MSDSVFRYCDDLGPRAIHHLYEPALGLRAIVVVDNVAAGASIGGVRMSPDVSLDECFRLARAMTFKNAAAGLPHGGGKSVIFADPAMDPADKERLIRAFAQSIRTLTDYIPGPDMGTNEQAMAWVRDEIGRAVGLPKTIGGIPLDEIGATGWGLLSCADVACNKLGMSLAGARVAVQGFGAVGKHAARFLAGRGAVLVAAADSSATVYDGDGLYVDSLIAHKEQGGHMADFPAGEKLPRDALIGVDCDILIPAARPDVVRADNEAEVRARLIVPGANIGITAEAEDLLHRRGVMCMPDFIANAGGVICAAVEYRGGTQGDAFRLIDENIRGNTAEVIERANEARIAPREAAVAMAGDRVRSAMSYGRFD
ncbi:MAG: Glu/Leu/Phe/Val dehydrogenase [Gammaproteobacteria bacterium]|nr:Glu/Leu/Phe/Val dehydrogenase [Gammaproteobacteria bacterium]MDH5311748.1 Glu/Leu/Phe/Val dehydrogenase [Gammaproteobacteria bacterium]